jgi:hypothetical protein
MDPRIGKYRSGLFSFVSGVRSPLFAFRSVSLLTDRSIGCSGYFSRVLELLRAVRDGGSNSPLP